MRNNLLVGLLVGALAGAVTPGVGRAAELYNNWTTLCSANENHPAAVLAAADAAGWMTVNKSAFPAFTSPTFAFDDYAIRIKSDAAGLRILVAGSGKTASLTGGKATPADLCMVMSKPVDTASLAQARTWAALEPAVSQAKEGLDMYIFEDVAGIHHSLAKMTTTPDKALAAGTLRLFLVGAPPGQDASMLASASLKR